MLSKEIAPLGPLTLLRIFLVLLATSAEIFGSPCFADGINPLFFPGNRYARENVANSALGHWASDINLQFIGMKQSPAKQEALGDFLALSTAAGVNATINGFPDNMFPSDTRVAASSNILVIEYDRRFEYQLANGLSGSTSDELDISSASPPIQRILKEGVNRQSDGCLARWSATSDNRIEGFVLAIGGWLNKDDQVSCLSRFMPAMFGVSGAISLYDLRKMSQPSTSGPPVIYGDYSEIILELSVAAACRSELHVFDAACPFNAIDGIYQHHSDLAKAIKGSDLK